MSPCLANECERPEPCPTFGRRGPGVVRNVAKVITGPSARQGMLSVIDQAAVSLASFLTSVIVARATSQEGLGVYYLALTLVLLARGVQTQVLTAPYVIYCQRRRGDELATYTGSVLVHQLFFGAITTVCLLGVATAIGLGLGPRGLAPAAWALLAAMPILLLREFHRHHAISHLNMARVLALDAAAAVLQVSVLLLLWRFASLSVAGVYVVMGMAAGIVALAWFVLERGRWRIQRRRVAADWKGNWSFGRWALASHLAGCAIPFVMPWIVAAAAGQGAAGLYGACGTLAGVAGMFVTGLANYLSPKARRAFANQGEAALCRILIKAATVFTVVVSGLCVLSLIAGQYLMVLVYGSQYAGGGAILTVLLLSVLALSVQIVAGNGLWSIGQPKATFVPQLCVLVVTLGTAAVLVGPLGPMGAALAGLAGSVTGAVMNTLSFLQLIRTVSAEPACA